MVGIVTSANVTDLLAQAVSIVSAVWPLFLVAGGIPVGFYVAKKLIGLIPKR